MQKKILTIALEDVSSKIDKEGKEEKREAQNLADRFKNFGKAYFEFITTPGIDPANNAAPKLSDSFCSEVSQAYYQQGAEAILGAGRLVPFEVKTVSATPLVVRM